MNPVGILLAAGRGKRFDPSGARNKLLQPLPGGDVVAVASARKLLSILPTVIAVVPEEGDVAAALRALGCQVTVCVDAGSGMAASLVHAIRASLPNPGGWLVALADMPFVQPQTIQVLADALAGGADIAVPVTNGRRGNPVAFSAIHLHALLALEGDQGARSLLKSCPLTEVDVNDPGIFRDIDTPADL